MYWMITNRNAKSDAFGDEFSKMTFWKNESGKVDDFAAWKSMSADEFRQSVVQVANTFPAKIRSTSPFLSTASITAGHLLSNDTVALWKIFSAAPNRLVCAYCLPGLQKAPPLAIIPIARKRENRLRTSPTC